MGIRTNDFLAFNGDDVDMRLEFDHGLNTGYLKIGTTTVMSMTTSGVTETVLAQTLTGTLTVGEDGTGHDVLLYSATAGKSWLWDESADKMIVTGASSFQGTVDVGVNDTGFDVNFFGATAGKKMFWDESADTLFVVATLDVDGPVLVGVDDTGYDVTFFGATAGKKFFWDESADTLFLPATVDIDGTVTVGVDDTGYDVKFFGATTGKSLLWDESADTLIVTGGLTVTHAPDFSTAGLRTKQAVTNVNDTTPTDAELQTAFGGTAASLGRGFIGTIDDNDGNAIGYIVWTSDASFYFIIGTKAT